MAAALWMLIAMGASGAARASMPAEPQVWLAGGGGVVWVCERRVAPEATAGLRFAFRDTTTPAAHGFRPLPLGPISGEPAFVAVRGKSLHVLFTDGTHHRFAARTVLPIEAAPALRFVEVNLPSPLPRALAGDTPGDALYAVVTARQGRKILDETRERRRHAEKRRKPAPSRQAPAPAESATEMAPNNESPPPSSPGIPVMERADAPVFPAGDGPATPAVTAAEADAAAERILASADLVIARYGGGEWSIDRPAPAELRLDDPVACLLASGGALHLFLHDAAAPGVYRHFASPSAGQPWSAPAELSFEPGAALATAGWVRDGAVLIIRGGPSAPSSWRLMTLKDGAWQPGAALAAGAGPDQDVGEPLGLAVFDEGAVLARRDPRGIIRVGLWSPQDGRQVEPYATILALAPQPPELIPMWIVETVQIGVFLLALAAVFFWRREAILTPAAVRPGYMLCPLMVRLLAFVLDAIILAPAFGAALYLLARSDDSGLTFAEQLWLMPTLTGRLGLSVILGTFGVIHALYGTVCEMSLAATFGKRIVGAQVVGQDGAPASRGGIVVRNVLRALELAVPGVLLLVMMTRNRQRLGDIAAGTVVIVRATPGMMPPQPPENQSGSPEE